MLLCIVCVADVVVVNLTAAVFIEDFVGFLDKGDAPGCHGSFHDSQELIIVNRAIAVLIKSSEERLDVHIGELEAGLSAALGELLQIKGTGAVVIHDLEDTADTDD